MLEKGKAATQYSMENPMDGSLLKLRGYKRIGHDWK